MILRFTTIGLLFLPLAAGATEPLQWKWAEGDESRYLMTQTMSMSMDAGDAGQIESTTRQQMLLRWAVEEINAEGAAVISQGMDRITMETDGPMGQGFTYDSASDAPPVGMAAMVAPILDAMVASDMQVTMAPTGELTEVQFTEDLAEAFKRLPGGSVSSDMVTQISKKMAFQFPKEPLEVGKSWTTTATINAPQMGKMKTDTVYSYIGKKEIEGQTLEAFSVAITIHSAGAGQLDVPMSITSRESSGEILFDRETGRLVHSKLTQVMDIVVTVDEKEVMNTVEQTVEMRELGAEEEAVFDLVSQKPEVSMAE